MSDDHAGEPPPDLDHLRTLIDDLDQRLVELLNERARVVVDVGRAKHGDGTPIYAPDRESAVLGRVLAANAGPLPERTLEGIWRELMSGSFRLERPLRIGYLGPEGSFSHLASLRHFGSSTELAPMTAIRAGVEEVMHDRADYGLVPYENSIGGSITETLDAIAELDAPVCAESMIAIDQSLMANCPTEEIEAVASKPEALAQCGRFLAANLPHAEIVETTSTSAAVIRAAETPGTAAIGCRLGGEIHGVKVVFDRIQDRRENITRFLIIGRQAPAPTGNDRTTVQFQTMNRPGALVDVLASFRDAGVNLTHIDKRPSRMDNWQYTFFIDLEGHQADPAVTAALEDARAHCASLHVRGSYPRSTRVL
ncbi:MAG: prephenate dehydratase [Planctomycetota bacterium]|jgi:chorismate mutase/prephenate dehydratase